MITTMIWRFDNLFITQMLVKRYFMYFEMNYFDTFWPGGPGLPGVPGLPAVPDSP